MKIPLVLALTLVGLGFMAACEKPPEVVQGMVVIFDAANETMKLTDESTPGSTFEFSLKGAEIGAAAHPGDTVRVAYRELDGKLVATRIMKIIKEKQTSS